MKLGTNREFAEAFCFFFFAKIWDSCLQNSAVPSQTPVPPRSRPFLPPFPPVPPPFPRCPPFPDDKAESTSRKTEKNGQTRFLDQTRQTNPWPCSPSFRAEFGNFRLQPPRSLTTGPSKGVLLPKRRHTVPSGHLKPCEQ